MVIVAHQTGNHILHALNGGEQRINGHYVDGYDPERRVIYEFMGCLWHGCKKCYLPETINPVTTTTTTRATSAELRALKPSHVYC